MKTLLKLLWERLVAFLTRFATFLKKNHIATIAGIMAAILAGIISNLVVRKLTVPPSPDPIAELISKEAELARTWPHDETNLRNYGNLFTDDALVIDYKQPKGEWNGRAKIESRLRPLHFRTLYHTAVIQMNSSDEATADTHTTFSQIEPDQADCVCKESWQFSKVKEKWWKAKEWKIRRFTFNVP